MFIPRLKAFYFLIGFFCSFTQTVCAQDQRVADSLTILYQKNHLDGIEELELVKNLAFNEKRDPVLALHYAEELIRLSKKENNQDYLYSGYLQKGYSHLFAGDSQEALSAFFTCAEIALQQKNIGSEGVAYSTIADVYSSYGNYENSQKYYSRAIELLRLSQDSIGLAAAFLNAGDAYLKNKEYDKAINFFQESGNIYSDLNYEIGNAYNLGNLGIVYAEQGKDSLAERNINQAIAILEKIQDYYPVSVYLTYMSDIYLRKNQYEKALEYANRSLELAQEYGLKEQISQANLKLFELNHTNQNFEASIIYLKNYYAYRDSMLNLKTIEQMADLRTDYEVSQKQTEVDLKQTEVNLLDQQKKNQQLISLAIGIGLLLIIVVAIALYRRNNFISKAKLLVEKEKERSDLLLLNILPEQTAQELKEKGKVQARKFDSISVMFTDFQAFTKYSQDLSPEKLVKSVDYYFSAFDEIIENHGLEKIKTIGDAYMCAGGLMSKDLNQVIKVINAAFEILEFVKAESKSTNDEIVHFNIRIGINTGPVVAGVVGTKKFAYDIWGDTVNVAARMESNSEPGKINVSETTYNMIKDRYKCIYRGEIEAKNKGMLKMYFVEQAIEKE